MHSTRKTSGLALALLATTMLTQPGQADAAPGNALGPEFQVNSYTTGNQRSPVVAMDADGDFVVVWESVYQDDPADFETYGIFAQRFNAAGVAQGPEFLVNSVTTSNQRSPAVAMDADGDFVVAWSSLGQDDPSYANGYGVFAQRFDAAGVAQGPEFQVNSYTTGNQRSPVVAMDADGDFVVVWTGFNQPDGYQLDIYARRFNAAGANQGNEFLVNTTTANSQSEPAVAMDALGGFVVTWSGNGPGDTSGVFAQRYNAAGATQGTEFLVNTTTSGAQDRPAIAMDTDGDFVVAWTDTGGADGEFGGIFAQRFDAAGTEQGPEFLVNAGRTADDQTNPAVDMDANGDFVVAWQSELPSSGYDVFARRYNAAGATQGTESQVNTFTSRAQDRPAVALDADGDFVVAWQSRGQDDPSSVNGIGVFAQRFDGAKRIEGDFDGDGNADLLWRNTSTGNTNIWLMEGEQRLAAQSIGAPPLVWRVAGVGEFNGDGKADILWHNTATGVALVWQMDGFVREAVVTIGQPGTVWAVEKLEDTNGDGLSDILWRNTTSGVTVVWQMLDYTRVAVGGTGTVAAAWQVQ